ncbi:MAG TPA: hypothetical protein VFQ85_11930 [Mycobacteriales bacterium]|jgi:hypothetical protein|nr:hypothetical protein [Mycobacteriales bacterium]
MGVYDDLRAKALAVTAAEAGGTVDEVHGALLETTMDNGVYTLLCLADGTTSLYLSSGGGVIGGGAHPPVVAANAAFLAAVTAHLAAFGPDPDGALPPVGGTTLRALTRGGRRALTAPEEDLGEGRHPASPVFYAAHEVIARLRHLMPQP